MPIEVSGKLFYTLTEVADFADVTRQTIWRWRKAGKIPDGRKYRGREVLFNRGEVEEIYAHANRLEPSDLASDFENQLKLFKQESA
jgi:predicted DNA-binding transcriptional regulator AlpA